MVRGSASDENHSSTPSNDTEVSLETSESDGVSIEIDTTSHRVDDGFRLFVNLFLHEVVKLSLHDRGEFDLEGFDGTDGGSGTVVTTETVNVEFWRERKKVNACFEFDEVKLLTYLLQQCERCHHLRGRGLAWCVRQWRKRRKR